MSIRLILALSLMACSVVNAAPIKWNDEQARDNANDVVKVIAKGEKDLKRATSLGDTDGIFNLIMRPNARILQSWREQREELKNQAVDRFSGCFFALIDFNRYADTYSRSDSLMNDRNRSDYKRNYMTELKDCRDAVRHR